ncbi:MAG: glycosyltransferase, partial [Minisyncoccia bacterium]
GIIIPSWHPDTMPVDTIVPILTACLQDSDLLAQPGNVLLVADGSDHTHRAAQIVRNQIGGFEILVPARNQGKGGAVAAGIERLLNNPHIQYIVTRDHDNDHLINDTPNLVRLTAHMRRQLAGDNVMTIGRRHSIHRALGFIRGEFEWMMDEVAMAAITYALARQAQTVNTQYWSAYDMTPDMQSGFKCYTRLTAERLLHAMQQAAEVAPGLDVLRHGAEIPVIAETMLSGGVVGEINCLSGEVPHMTTYDQAGRFEVKGTVLAWTLQRTGVPTGVARQLMLNAIARRLLAKDRKGGDDLLTLCNGVLAQLAAWRDEPVAPNTALRGSDYF